MKAIIQDKYGSADVLEFREVEQPAAGDDDVLIEVHAAGVGVICPWRLIDVLPLNAWQPL